MKNKTLKKKVKSKHARRVNLDIEALQHYNVQNDKMILIMRFTYLSVIKKKRVVKVYFK